MEFGQVNCHIRGTQASLMHNGRLANPRDKYTQEIKKITGKRKKTDEDLEQLIWLEWRGGLYEQDGRIGWPGEVLEGLIRDGAKTTRGGTTAEKAILCEGFFPLDYSGPKDIEKLFQDNSFVDVRGVVVGGKRIQRARPFFPAGWELKFTVSYYTDIIDAEDVIRWLNHAALHVGLSDFRPKYGRFEVLQARALAAA